jgi:hypothetical protein
MDHLGPFTVAQLRNIGQRFAPTASNRTEIYSAASELPQAIRHIAEGLPAVLLWRETPDFGHFILRHTRHVRGVADVELFDPLGTSTADKAWLSYMDDPTGLNSGGLRPVLRDIDASGGRLSFNRPTTAPQNEKTNSCGLWCLLRAGFPNLSPSEFARASRSRLH